MQGRGRSRDEGDEGRLLARSGAPPHGGAHREPAGRLGALRRSSSAARSAVTSGASSRRRPRRIREMARLDGVIRTKTAEGKMQLGVIARHAVRARARSRLLVARLFRPAPAVRGWIRGVGDGRRLLGRRARSGRARSSRWTSEEDVMGSSTRRSLEDAFPRRRRASRSFSSSTRWRARPRASRADSACAA